MLRGSPTPESRTSGHEQRDAAQGGVMRNTRLVLLAMLLALPFAVSAKAQVGVGVGVGPAVVDGPGLTITQRAATTVTVRRYASGAITPITPMPALLTAITGLSWFSAAYLSASVPGTTGAGAWRLRLSRRVRLRRRRLWLWRTRRIWVRQPRRSWRTCAAMRAAWLAAVMAARHAAYGGGG